MPLLNLRNGRLSAVVEEPFEEVGLAAWRANQEVNANVAALVIANDECLEDIANDLHAFSVIILQFPQFKDGRAYSQAYLLRERYGFKGEIRARGDILRDQLLFMARCGIDGFEFANNEAAANDALMEFSFTYQPAADGAAPIWRRRLALAQAA